MDGAGRTAVQCCRLGIDLTFLATVASRRKSIPMTMHLQHLAHLMQPSIPTTMHLKRMHLCAELLSWVCTSIPRGRGVTPEIDTDDDAVSALAHHVQPSIPTTTRLYDAVIAWQLCCEQQSGTVPGGGEEARTVSRNPVSSRQSRSEHRRDGVLLKIGLGS